MTPADKDFDDRLVDLLAARAAARAAGQTPPPGDDSSLTPEFRAELEEAEALMRLLEADGARGMPPDTGPDRSCVGRFEIVRELGRGGCGVVYLARDPRLRREVALKLPFPEVLLDPAWRRRFVREGRLAAGLEHPNLVPVYESGESGAACFLVSRYCRGENLRDWLQRQTAPVSPEAAARLVAAVAGAVHYVHAHNIRHRDIKPGNILLEPVEGAPGDDLNGFTPLLTDFGLAKEVAADGQALSRGDTRSHALLGTPLYMAPEQADGRPGDIGPATDVYALGVVLYELLTGQPPYVGESELEIRRRIVGEEPVPPRQRRPGVPRDLEAVCLKCLEKRPEHRFATAGELAEELQRWLAGAPTRTPVAGPARRLGRFLRKHSAKTLVACLTPCLILLLVVWNRPDDPEKPLKEVVRLLEGGNAVTWIPEAGKPAYTRWVDKPGILQQYTSRFGFHTLDHALLEIVPQARLAGYQIRARVKHVRTANQHGAVGLYFGHSRHGKNHLYVTLSYNEFVANRTTPNGDPAGVVRVQYWHEAESHFTDRYQVRMNHYFTPAAQLGSGEAPWRDVALRVTSEEIVVQWENQTIYTIPRGQFQRPGRNALRRFVEQPGPPDLESLISPRDGFGLYVSNGWANFQHVVIEPLP